MRGEYARFKIWTGDARQFYSSFSSDALILEHGDMASGVSFFCVSMLASEAEAVVSVHIEWLIFERGRRSHLETGKIEERELATPAVIQLRPPANAIVGLKMLLPVVFQEYQSVIGYDGNEL